MNYHDRPELSSSQIAGFLNDPIQWWHEWILKDWVHEVTSEMKLGTMVHAALETGRIDSIVREIPRDVLNADGHCKGKPWTEWKAANPAEIYLKPGEKHPIFTIMDHIWANEFCLALFQDGDKEVEHYWFDPDFGPCRIRMDCVLGPALVDWKTTSKRCARTFAIDAVARHYDVRLAFYRRGFRDKYGQDPEVYVVAICTAGGMSVVPYRLTAEWLDDAEARLILAVDAMQRFDLTKYLNRRPVVLTQPKWSQVNFDE